MNALSIWVMFLYTIDKSYSIFNSSFQYQTYRFNRYIIEHIMNRHYNVHLWNKKYVYSFRIKCFNLCTSIVYFKGLDKQKGLLSLVKRIGWYLFYIHEDLQFQTSLINRNWIIYYSSFSFLYILFFFYFCF